MSVPPWAERLWHSHSVSPTATTTAKERLEQRFGAVIEGRCPDDGTTLIRLERCGWCYVCDRGFMAITLREDHEPFTAGEHVVTTVFNLDELNGRPPHPMHHY